jgi:plastocyanin
MRRYTILTTRVLAAVAMPTLALALSATGCQRGRAPATASPPEAGAATTAAAAAEVRRVSIDNFNFDPPSLTVPAGTTVTWANRDDVPHTVTAYDKHFASGTLDTDGQFAHRFTAPGTYDYYCAVHPHMTGRVIVK